MRILAAILLIGALSGAAHAQIVNPGGGGAGTNVTVVNPVDGGLNVKVNCVVGCAGGTFNNNADGVATSATNGQSAAWLYAYNGATWDRLRDDANKNLLINFGTGATLPTGSNTIGAVTQASGPWTVGLNATPSIANGNGVVPAVGGTAVSTSNPMPSSGSYFTNVVSSVLTRASDTTAYTANTTVCLLKSVTACAPLTISIAQTNAGKGLITRISLLKSGATTTNANFTIWLFSAAPGVASPAQYDNVSYTGPRIADMPNYIGSAVCATPVATSDTSAGVWYDCSLSNPNTSGALVFQALAGSTNVDALISVNAAYTPVSAETFTAYVSGIY